MFGDASAYERFMGRWSVLLAPAFLDVVGLDVATPPVRVLDVGSGTGHLALEVAGRWPRCEVVGVDPAPGFVEAARQRVRATGDAPRVRFEVGEAEHLPLEDGSVDATVSLLVMTFLSDPVRAMAEMLRVTRAGGVVAAAVWDYGGGMGMLRALWDAAARLDPSVVGQDEATMPLGRPGGLAGLWRGSGLTGVDDGAVEVRRRYGTFEDYWAPFLHGTGPAGVYVAGLTDAGRAALRAELLATLGPGPFELTSRAWWVRGTAAG
ncbi:class I SAM-dependent methyltransferase [Fodinibacter luteus]|uniref:Class I SAM-dependent methyltransferase n=1 Tax=Fodinibacter luteus TaxID=552064 RepID=A0ABP8K086_9MICO